MEVPLYKQSHEHNLETGVTSVRGRRPYMEDEYLIAPNLHLRHPQSENILPTHIFAVFDGHAGGKCSKALKASLTDFMLSEAHFETDPRENMLVSFHRLVYSHLTLSFIFRLSLPSSHQ